MSTGARVAISGAGRVFERLYLPAIRSLPGIRVTAVADPTPGRPALAALSVPTFPSLPQLLDEATVDAVVVLSPPAIHHSDAAAALTRALPVLVEKPMCISPAEADGLGDLGAHRLLTPAFSRRYWPAYLRLAERRPVLDLRLAIRVSAGAWGAYSGPTDIAEDLFPHVADLARWLGRSEIETVRARRAASGVEIGLELAGGRTATARLDSGDHYREAVKADGRVVRVGPPAAAASFVRRVGRRDDPPVAAIGAMLRDWLTSLRGATPPLLPRFADGEASTAAMERLRQALA